jgi:hypothetical protein
LRGTRRAGSSWRTDSNNRIQIYDQNGTLLETGWEQYSRISGLWIDRNDVLFAADSESGSVAPDRKDWTRGMRIGQVRDGKDGKVQFFIPDPCQTRPIRAAPKGSRWTPPATFMGLKWASAP